MEKVLTDLQLNEIKQIDGVMIKNHQPHAKCGSSDGASLYQKDYQGSDIIDGYCYACSKYIRPEEVSDIEPVDIEEIEQINTEKLEEILRLPMRGWRERKVNKATSEFYGVRSELDADGRVLNRFYPCYDLDGELTRFKARNCLEKAFWSVGKKSRKEQLFGQTLFPKGGKYLVIAGGEEDAMSAFQMLRSTKYMTPCVAPTNGEGSLAKQIQDNFDYVTSFETVIFMLDNDKVGKESAEAAMKLLRPNQGRIWKPNEKDVNDYLVKDKIEEFRGAFFKAEYKTPAGVVSSSDSKLWDAIVARAKSVKIPLPPFAKQLQEKLRGGPALGEITLIAAASSIGKTSLLNAFTYYWIFNAPYKVGIISLESDLGELGENLLSLHLGQKLANMYDDEKLELLTDEVKHKMLNELGKNEKGEDRYTILDHQSAIMDDELKRKIEYLVKVDGCKIIILDPVTLALSGQSNDAVDSFNAWYLRFVKREQIAAFNVVHVRKNANNSKANSRGAEISEEDLKGSGSIFQTAMNIWLLMRDKYNDDPIIQNTTKVVQSKARRTGLTGTAGYWYYNNETGEFEVGRNPDDINTEGDLKMFEELGAFNDENPEDFKY